MFIRRDIKKFEEFSKGIRESRTPRAITSLSGVSNSGSHATGETDLSLEDNPAEKLYCMTCGKEKDLFDFFNGKEIFEGCQQCRLSKISTMIENAGFNNDGNGKKPKIAFNSGESLSIQ